ncbi:hypothetical protein SKAU_G00045990 [Synaphobranchus kaupii]|uniref:Uncharacterized protein n=1 Tax=Synaphobranchus kaupii TaxID=118154 RepID=A0A9Q1G332_SYNKA|nr:hypothetical protein SKAU_G00045990 [Synaphobranchus kaupii]
MRRCKALPPKDSCSRLRGQLGPQPGAGDGGSCDGAPFSRGRSLGQRRSVDLSGPFPAQEHSIFPSGQGGRVDEGGAHGGATAQRAS